MTLSKLDLNQFNFEEIEKYLRFLEFDNIGLNLQISELEPFKLKHQFNFFSRLDLIEGKNLSQKNMKQILQSERSKYHIVVAEVKSPAMASFCARDGRIDAIKLTMNSSIKIFNAKYGRRLEENNKLIEVDLSPFFESKRGKNLRQILRILEAVERCDLKFVLFANFESKFSLRSYRGLQAIGRILGLSNKQTNVKHIKERYIVNQKKIDGKIPFDGVEIVEW